MQRKEDNKKGESITLFKDPSILVSTIAKCLHPHILQNIKEMNM